MPRPTRINIRHGVLALAREGMRQSAIAGRVGLTRTTVNRILRRHAATGPWGLLRIHTSSRRCFVEDGLTGSLHKCPGLDGADEEFVWNEGSCPVVTIPIDSQGSPCWLPTTTVSAWSGHRHGILRNTLTHWGRVTHICVGKLTIIGADSDLSPERHQAIIWTNAGILLIGPLETNFIEILIEIQAFSLKKVCLKMSSVKCCSFRLGLNVLMSFVRQHFGDNYRYQYDDTTPHHARTVLDFIQQGNVTKMEQPAKSPHCNTIEHIWDGLRHAITSIDPPQNLVGLR